MQKNGNHKSLSDHSAIKLELRIQKLTQNSETDSELYSFMENEQLALEC